MAVISSNDFVMHPSTNMNQTSGAGGIMDGTKTIATNQIAALVSDILASERLAGVTRKYKIFLKIGNTDDLTYKNASVWVASPLLTYKLHLLKGTFTDVWADVSAQRKYGCGTLATAVLANAQTVVVNTDGASYNHFQNGDLIAIFDQMTPTDSTGNLDLVRIDQAPAWNGDEVTLHFSTPLRSSYATSRLTGGVTVKTRIASCAEYGDVKGSATTSDKSSVHGTVDATKLSVDSIGGITQTATLTFENGTDFNVVSNLAGVTLPVGQKTSEYAPINPNYPGQPYFTVPTAFWTDDGSGSWTAGDSIKITTNPAALPIWVVIEVAAGSPASALEVIDLWNYGYSGSN